MEIKTGKAHGESDSPAVVVPPDRGRPARKMTAQKLPRGRNVVARLLAVFKVLAAVSIVALAIVAGFATYRYIDTANMFRLRNIRVDGCLHSDPGAIEAIVRQSFPASTNILRIDLNHLRSHLEQQPWIRSVEIRRILPSGLNIYVRERVPSVIADIGGELQLLDSEGVLLDHYDPAYGKLDIPVFSGLRGDDVEAYKVLQEENSSRVRIGVEVLTELAAGSPDFTRAISEIDLSDPSNVKVLLVDDTAEVFLGDRDFFKRFQMFMSNLSDYQDLKAQGKEVATVDLRFDSQIVYRLKHPADEQGDAKAKMIRN
ncbi:MAG: FtsQ-type POTRA domain-containing protein [Acidobacteriia bacterium]|nr:FtsQ-type POTRA domain-containing protein [Terriglobia bacterium]